MHVYFWWGYVTLSWSVEIEREQAIQLVENNIDSQFTNLDYHPSSDTC